MALYLKSEALDRGRWGKLVRRASTPSTFCRKLLVQWSRAFAQPIPFLQPTTTLCQISFFQAERKVIYEKLIFDDNLDFENFSSASAFAVVMH